MDDRLLDLYEDELRHLRETAAEFAREFPKVAGRLALDDDPANACPDPYVERLLEGFAFMAARVHLKLEASFPQFTQGLLETVYPDYLSPVPSMCVVQLMPDEGEGALATGVTVPRGTLLRGPLAKREHTRATFSTAHPVRLLPFRIQGAQYYGRDLGQLDLPGDIPGRAALAIRLRKTLPVPFTELRVPSLVFHLHGEGDLPVLLYEQILSRRVAVVIQSPITHEIFGVLNADCICKVGFTSEESLLPPSPRGFEGYRLLKEYFALPQRFLFLEIQGVEAALRRAKGEEVQLVLVLSERDTTLEDRVGIDTFRLHCTPAINLFEKQLDRVPVGQESSEYHVVPDRNRPLDFEVYRVVNVTGFSDTAVDEQVFQPFYTARDTETGGAAYYTTNRVTRLMTAAERQTGRRSTYSGTDVFLSLVDGERAPFHPDIRQLGVRALCSNRHLPLLIPTGGNAEFTTESAAHLVGIRTVSGPTPPRASPIEGTIAWRLIDHLSLNYFSIADQGADKGARAFREMLTLYVDPQDKAAQKQIESIRSLRSRPVLRRVVAPGPITFARGLEVQIEVDEAGFQGTGAFLMASVLEEFFARYVGINSFTETVLGSLQRKEIMRWPARTGTKQIL